MKPAPIIAGIDFSASSTAVLHHASRAAAQGGGMVVAAHVLDSGSLAHQAATMAPGLSVDLLVGQAREKLARLVAAVPMPGEVRLEVRLGRPAEELENLAAVSEARLLVIAANDFTKSRLGVIAARCVRSAPCDVLVVRDWQEGNFTKILLCADLSGTSARALERAVSLATAHGAKLEIAHVIYPPSRDVWGEVLEHDMDAGTSYEEESRAKATRELGAFLAPEAARLAVIPHTSVILESVVASVALTHHIRNSGANLVVLGTRRHTGLAGRFLGTNAERLLHDATVSVLAVRD